MKRAGYRAVKRAFDVALGLAVVCVGLVPGAVVTALVAADTRAFPFYLQERLGQNGRPFRIVKYRTMRADADDLAKYLTPEQASAWHREHKVADDPRITPLGRVLRSASIDELPNFLNVLAGQMSVVGCRAITSEELAWFGDEAAELLSMRPGITGWWQVTARSDSLFETGDRQARDLYYVRNASLSLDARIVLLTFRAVLRRTGR